MTSTLSASNRIDPQRFLTMAEVAAELRVSRRTIERHVREGTIRAIRLGRLRRVPASEIVRLRASAGSG
ncbi:helix-turn-helix domain-containing protein [Pseudonocardia sp. C8]|uniref:helix-turn-helix domain-containing protein n=1 Tax=Pseudonocardia sp. C8 TaxID=2762759 RepID=UPI00351C688E